MKNYYPLKNINTLEYAIDRLEIKNVFPGFDKWHIGDLIIKHYKQGQVIIYWHHKGLGHHENAPVVEMIDDYRLDLDTCDEKSCYQTDELYMSKEDIIALEQGDFSETPKYTLGSELSPRFFLVTH